MKCCRITVLKTLINEDLVREHTSLTPIPCHCMKEGDVFYTAGPFGTDMPEGFCGSAWNSMRDEAGVFASGGRIHNIEDRYHIVSCPDGLRPVIFLLEPWEDDRPGEVIPS